MACSLALPASTFAICALPFRFVNVIGGLNDETLSRPQDTLMIICETLQDNSFHHPDVSMAEPHKGIFENQQKEPQTTGFSGSNFINRKCPFRCSVCGRWLLLAASDKRRNNSVEFLFSFYFFIIIVIESTIILIQWMNLLWHHWPSFFLRRDGTSSFLFISKNSIA